MRKFASALLLFSLGLSLGACGGGNPSSGSTSSTESTGTTSTRTSTNTAPTDWPGPSQPSVDGSIETEGFNDWAETQLPASKRVPRELAIAFLRPTGDYKATVTNRTGGATVVVVRNNLEDDSVNAIRYELGFGLVSGGKWRLFTAKVAYKCQQGRGHQKFSTVLCS
jgi:hypothetical protein